MAYHLLIGCGVEPTLIAAQGAKTELGRFKPLESAVLAAVPISRGFAYGDKMEQAKKKRKKAAPRGEAFYLAKLKACRKAKFIGVALVLQDQRKINCMTVIEMECRECGHHWNTSYQRLMVVKSGCPRCYRIKRFGTDEPNSAPKVKLDPAYVDSMVVGAISSFRSRGVDWANRKTIKQEISRITSAKVPMAEIQKSMIRLWKREICMIDGITKETIYF